MTRRSISRAKLSSLSAFLAIGLGVALVGAAAAQSQLPGTALTTDPANDLRPAWSPDGASIAYHSTRTGNNEIWLMAADGGQQRQLTNDPADDRRPAWSPDGAWIAFDSDRSGVRDLWIADTQGGNLMQVTSGPGLDTFASWSPDGTRLAYYRYENGVMDLWTVDVQGLLAGGAADEPVRLTDNLADERRNQCTFACHSPSWSPDSRRLAYQAGNHTQVWTIDDDGQNAQQITGGGTYEHFPSWTPDGKILFLSEHVTEQQEPVNDVWIIDADGTNAAVLYQDIPHGGPFEFRPDGATIAFHSPRAGNFDIYTTVLGQAASAPQPFVATPMIELSIESTAAPAMEPTPAPAVQPIGMAAPILAIVGVAAVLVLGGAGLAFYLLRRGRTT